MSAKRKAQDVENEAQSKQHKVDVNEEKSEVIENENAGENSVASSAKNANGSQEELTEVEENANEETVAKSDNCGVMLICGGTNWDLIGRKAPPKGVKGGTGRNLWSPHRLGPLNGVRVRLVASGCTSSHSIVITEAGKAMSFGRNEKGQLGHGDTKRRDVPTLIEALKEHNIMGAACGRNHTLILTDRGTVYAFGDNKQGQCGVGNQQQLILNPTRISYEGPPIVKVSCGGEFSVILDCKGSLHSFGCPEYGQLGHNTDGKYFVTSTKLGFHCETTPKRIVMFVEKTKDGHKTPIDVVEIIDFSCGANHVVAVDSKRRVFSWGFGGYGRLGHAEQKDEMVPRLIKFFDMQGKGVKSVHCGTSFSLAINDFGAVYLFGLTKRTGEANMYPKPVQDLAGWNVRSVGCGVTSIVIAADDSVIAWGPSPTYGELGFGEIHKSSTTPMEVKALEGIYVMQVTLGMGHSLFVVRDHTEQECERINKLPEFTP